VPASTVNAVTLNILYDVPRGIDTGNSLRGSVALSRVDDVISVV
jgi:hypothetical protein